MAEDYIDIVTDAQTNEIKNVHYRLHVPNEFFQIYKTENQVSLCYKLKSIRQFCLLCFMVEKMDDKNLVHFGPEKRTQFLDRYKNNTGNSMDRSTVSKMLKSLVEESVIEKLGNKSYKMNILLLWKSDQKSRVETIKYDLKSIARSGLPKYFGEPLKKKLLKR